METDPKQIRSRPQPRPQLHDGSGKADQSGVEWFNEQKKSRSTEYFLVLTVFNDSKDKNSLFAKVTLAKAISQVRLAMRV